MVFNFTRKFNLTYAVPVVLQMGFNFGCLVPTHTSFNPKSDLYEPLLYEKVGTLLYCCGMLKTELHPYKNFNEAEKCDLSSLLHKQLELNSVKGWLNLEHLSGKVVS